MRRVHGALAIAKRQLAIAEARLGRALGVADHWRGAHGRQWLDDARTLHKCALAACQDARSLFSQPG